MRRPFQSEEVLTEKISEATLRAYHVGFDQNKFRLEPLVDVIRSVIPEFALGYIDNIPATDIVEKLQEAAGVIYTTDKYKRRGEFGELILHLLLRDFCNTVPLISKIYFKDSTNSTVHGFDGVHVTVEGKKKILWLGESKMYNDGKKGLSSLVEDLKEHLKADYLRKEFSIISRKLPKNFPDIEYWRRLMHKHNTLDKIYDGICIPMVCTYSSDLFKKHDTETRDYLKDFISEAKELKKYFDSHKIKTNVDIILMLLPVPSKDDLNKALDQRLKAMQQI